MAKITTEKLFFRGTPAQFYAVMQEYQLDAETVGNTIDCQLIEPTEEVIIPPRISTNAENSILDELGFRRRRTIVKLHSDSPRAVLRLQYGSLADLTISALACPEDRTQITVRTREDFWETAKAHWEPIVSYIDNLGYLEDSEAVQKVKLLEPEEWLKKLNETGFSTGSPKWWKIIDEWTRSYWVQKGKRALPIQGRLDNCIGFSRQHIYRNTSFGDKDVTPSDTE